MNKNFLKKLAFVLALAMVVTTMAPAAAATVSAATGIEQKNGKAFPSIYAAGKKFTVAMSQLNATSKVVWTSSDKSVATVGLTTGRVTAKAPGTTTIKATIKNKKTNAVKTTYSRTLRVVERSTALATDPTEVSLKVKETATIKASLTPSTSTDVVEFYSTDKTVATVGKKSGVVTAVKDGEATIKVYAKATADTSTKNKLNQVAEVKVTVGSRMASVTQTAYNKVDVMFGVDVKDVVKASDFSVVKDETNQVFAVKTATVDSTDTKKVTLEVFGNMTDGKAYTVTFGDQKLSFTATDNKVAAVEVSPVAIAYNTETEIKAILKDANGIVLGEYLYGDTAGEPKLEFNITTNQGYTTGNGKLALYNKGNTAKATVIYHTYQYDSTGTETGAIKSEVTITAVDPEAVSVSGYKYTIADKAPNWNTSVTTNTKIAVEEKGKKVYVNIKNSKGDDITENYTLDSSNTNILLVENTKNGKEGAGIDGVAVGTAAVLVKDKNGTVVNSLPVTVVAKREAVAIVLTPESFNLSTYADANDTKTVDVRLNDQYGEKLADPTDITVECVSSNKNYVGSSVYTTDAGKVTFYGKEFAKAGTYTFRITAAKKARTVTINVQDVDTSKTTEFRLELSTNNIDAKYEGKQKAITAQVVMTKGGVRYGIAQGATIRILKGGKDQVVTSSSTGVVFNVTTVTGSTVSKVETGSYSVIATGYNDKTNAQLNSGFSVEDTQTGILLEKQNELSLTDTGSVNDLVAKAFKFTYNGEEVGKTAEDIDSAEFTKTGNSYYIKTATVKVEYENSGIYVPIKVTVGKSFTVK